MSNTYCKWLLCDTQYFFGAARHLSRVDKEAFVEFIMSTEKEQMVCQRIDSVSLIKIVCGAAASTLSIAIMKSLVLDNFEPKMTGLNCVAGIGAFKRFQEFTRSNAFQTSVDKILHRQTGSSSSDSDVPGSKNSQCFA